MLNKRAFGQFYGAFWTNLSHILIEIYSYRNSSQQLRSQAWRVKLSPGGKNPTGSERRKRDRVVRANQGIRKDRGGAASRGICEVAQNVERRETGEGPIKAAKRLKAKPKAVRPVKLLRPVPAVGFLTTFTRSAAVWDRKPSSNPDKRTQFAGGHRRRISQLTSPGKGGR
jgi:hypothetical protein